MKKFIHTTIALLAILIISNTHAVADTQQAVMVVDTVTKKKASPRTILLQDGTTIENTVVMINDTTTSLGRKFNRGLTNYRFIPRGEWLCGLSVSYTGLNSDDSDILLLIKDFDFTGSLFGINPYVAYFISDNNCIGLKLGYSATSADLGNFNLDIIDDMNISLSDLSYNLKKFSAGIFHRAYLGLTKSGQIGVFNETSLTFESGTSHFIRGNEETGIKDTKTISNEIALGLNPGISVFVLKNISANVSVGILGLSYKQCKQYIDNVETGTYKSGGANFKINILNINIGITVHI